MNRKNIFKTLAFAMLMPAILLTTACSNDDDAVNTENTAKKGYALPVTINVTRQGDDATTRATYNDGTKKLEFSTGDKLFVDGAYQPFYSFAGTLTWQSGGTFSGTIYTQTEYSGTAYDLLSDPSLLSLVAYLLPAGYETPGLGFLTVTNEGAYNAHLSVDYSKAFVTSKVAAVEQISLEKANTGYTNNGFVLEARNAILNFTITGLAANTPNVPVVFSYQVDNGPALPPTTTTVSKSVTTDGSGNATFAIGVEGTTDLNVCTLTVGGKAVTLVNSSKTLSAGKIYNITRSAAPAGTTVTWNSSNASGLNLNNDSETIDGITIACNASDVIAQWSSTLIQFYISYVTGGYTFTNELSKNFTKIEITATGNLSLWESAKTELGSGWSWSSGKATWTGNAASVDMLTDCDNFSGQASSIVFTLE